MSLSAEELKARLVAVSVNAVEEEQVLETSANLRIFGRYGMMPADDHVMASPLRLTDLLRCRLSVARRADLLTAIEDREAEIAGLRKLADLLAGNRQAATVGDLPRDLLTAGPGE
jgi:hypothetical protein